MAYKVLGILNVINMKVNNYYVGTTLKYKNFSTLYEGDVEGNVTLPSLITKSQIDSMFKDLPVSQFGKLDGNSLSVQVSGRNISLVDTNPIFIAGQFFEIQPEVIDVSNTISGSGTVYVYVQLKLGIPYYVLSLVQIPETVTSMFIGTVTTNSSTNIISHTLRKVSRFDNYRPSITQTGGSFPVSTGYPSSIGNINW